MRKSMRAIAVGVGAVLGMGSPSLAFSTIEMVVASIGNGPLARRCTCSRTPLVFAPQRCMYPRSRRRSRTHLAVSENPGVNEEDASAPTGNIVRTLTSPEFSIAFGASILLAVLTNRLSTPDLVDSQARTDILGVIASGGLITNGVYLLDLNIKTADEVTLVGSFLQEYSSALSAVARQDLRWLAESLLLASPATSVAVYQDGKTLARVGVMGESPVVQDAAILQKSVREGKYGRELYLPALQVLPGKIEFDYLPENCQGVLMQPVLEGSALVIIGTNRARAFTPKDIAWIKGLCDQAALSLRQADAIMA